MRLTVLVNSQRFLSRLGTGASYLLEADGARVVVDAANGTAMRLATAADGRPVDAVVVSHFHADAVHDLLPVLASLAEDGRLVLPAGAGAAFRDAVAGLGVPPAELARVHVVERAEGEEERLGGLLVRFGPLRHGCPGHALRFESAEGSLVHVADTGPAHGLAAFARDTDLLLAHSFLLDEDEDAAARTNLSAATAGRLARDAGARRLALAHVPFYADVAPSLAEAASAFGGAVVALKEGDVVDI